MAAKPATAADEPAVVQWFASLFGQCWKEPSTAEDLQFDDLSPTDRQAKAGQQKSKQSQAAGKKEAAQAPAGTTGMPPTASRGEQVGNPFLIDNSVLQIKSHPGVAFRYSKSEADKVKSGPGPAKWGETVYGCDEGDGWLKVGNFYLPMMYQGVAIITPVAAQKVEGEATTKGAAPQSPSRAPATPVRNLPASPKGLPAVPGAPQASGAKEQKEEADEPQPQSKTEKAAASPLAAPPASTAAAPEEEEAAAAAPPACGELEETKEEAVVASEEAPEIRPPAWFAQPSVGTWLLPVPAARRMSSSSEQATTPVDSHVEAKVETCASIDTGCAEEQFVEASKALGIPCAEKVEAAALCLGDKLEASMAIEACSAEEEKVEACAPIEVCHIEDQKMEEKIVPVDACCMEEHSREGAPVEAQEVEWHLRPSVGAWLHSLPPQALASQ